MKLGTTDDGAAVLVDGEHFVALRSATGAPVSMLEVIEAESAQPGAAAAMAARGDTENAVPLGRLVAPIPLPGAVVAAPVNYLDHMVEMSEVRDIRHLGVFLKARSSVTGPGSVVRLPYSDRRFDYEGELGVVIGTTALNVGTADALDHVFGYTCLLDITMRGGEDRSTRKSFRTFTPTGPHIVTSEEIGDPTDLEIVLEVNGVERQHASTKEMVWSVAELISYASSVMTLYPGDIIASGTPVGVGPIDDGDVLDLSIDRIGTLHVSVSGEGAVPCPTLGAGEGPVPPPPR